MADRPCTATGASFPAAPIPASSQPPDWRPVGSPDAMPSFLGQRLLLSFNPLAGYRSGLRCSALRRMPSWAASFDLAVPQSRCLPRTYYTVCRLLHAIQRPLPDAQLQSSDPHAGWCGGRGLKTSGYPIGRRVVDSTKCPLAGGQYVWKFATTSSARFLRRHGRRIRNQASRRGQAFDATPIAA